MMCRTLTLALLAWALPFTTWAADPSTAETTLPRGLSSRYAQSMLRKVLPAVQMGDSYGVLNSLSRLTAQMPDKQIDAVNTWLKQLNMPELGELLAEARLNLVHQNGGADLPKPNSRELLLTLEAIRAQVAEISDQKLKHPAMADPLPHPQKLHDYKELFWKIHVYDNRLMSAAVMARYAQRLAGDSRVNRKYLTLEQVAVLDADYGQLQRDVLALQRELEEREAALRLQRFELAEKLLAESTQLSNQLLAVHVVQEDGPLLADYLNANNAQQFTLDSLNQTSSQDITTRAEAALQSVGKGVAKKSQLLYAGLHWWLRGRYGAGPDGGGLLKSQLAMQSPEAQFALYMPAQTPKPTDPSQESKSHGQVPQFDRRHHYIWALENRRIQTQDTIQRTGPGFKADITTQGFY